MNLLDEIIEEWNKDAIIDGLNLAEESINTSKLHAKYLAKRTKYNLKSKALSFEYKDRKIWKQQYFRGEFNNPTDLKTYNIPAFKGPFTKIDVDQFVELDKELNEILMKKAIYDEAVEFINMVLQELKQRTYSIGNAIKWNIFTSGG